MTSCAFDFLIGPRKSWAQGHVGQHPSVTLALTPLDPVGAQVRLTPDEAHAMAVALEAAATFAENATPRFPDVSCSNCGRGFGPGDHGYSHCDEHAGRPSHA